jgi:hypothetical protein
MDDQQPPQQPTRTWGEIQRKWGSIVAEYTVEQTKELIRLTVDRKEPFYTYSLLLVLKYRWDCPDPVFDLLEEIWALQKRHASREEIEAWGSRACSVLRQVIGDEPKSEELLRPLSTNAIN